MKKPFEEFKEFIKNKNVAVVGIGVSNIPLIKFLVKLGANVTAFDKKTKDELGNIAEDFEKISVKLELGENYLDNLTGFDVVFKTLRGCQTHEVLESSWPLWIKFPQAEGAMFAGQKAPNYHNLCHYDQIDLPFLEVPNPALQ